MGTTAQNVQTFYNENFFSGETPIQRIATIHFSDGSGNKVQLPPLQMNGTRIIDLAPLKINRDTPITTTIVLSNNWTIVLPPMLLDKGKTSIEQLCRSAYNLLDKTSGAPAAETENKDESEAEIPDEGAPAELVIDTADFDEVIYGRTEKSQKKYYIEVLKPEAAEREGVKYRVYRFEDNEQMNPKGPVARGVIKSYEIANGLRKK